MTRHKHFPRERGSALISTLLMVVVLTIIVTAFMQSMAVERRTANSYKNKLQAELAAEAGANAVIGRLSELTANDSFIITTDSTRTKFYLGGFQIPGVAIGSGSIGYQPLFSAGPTISEAFDVRVLAGNTLPNVTAKAPTKKVEPFPAQAGSQSVDISWIPISLDGKEVARFAFWAEDLGGYLEPKFMGKNATTRDTGTDPEEIGVFTIFDSQDTSGTGGQGAQNLILERSNLFTQATLNQVLTSADLAKSINFASFPADRSRIPGDRDTIPFGKGYVQEGTPKHNINYYIAQKDVEGLAKIISDNLPNFSNRKGGMTDDYNKTIAANIIDYADADSTPTVGSGYRGVDSTPFITIYYDKYDWYDQQPSGGVWNLHIRVTTYIQVWNLSNQEIDGTLTVTRNLSDFITVGFANHYFNDQSKIAPSSVGKPEEVIQFGSETQPKLGPNEVRVIELPPLDFRMPGSSVPIAVPAKPVLNGSTSTTVTGGEYSTRWNGALVDQLSGKTERPGKSIEYRTNPDWTGNLPSLRHDPYTTTKSLQPMGDPRSTYYLNSRVSANAYEARNSWGQMATMRDNRYLTEPTKWTDPLPFSGAPNPAPNSTASLSVTVNPITIANAATKNKPEEAPARFSNLGRIENMTELSNVYDPAQWFFSPYPGDQIPNNATANATYGGGITLRIGRPEHGKFAVDGQAAAQFLDLFDVTDPNSKTMQPTLNAELRINVNTAPRDVLRALIAGISSQRDSRLLAKYAQKSGEQGARFADAVIEKRKIQPFTALSDLAKLSDADGPIFGRADQWATANRPIHGAALEELFAKVYPLTSTRSRVFRIIAVGEALGASGKPTASSAKELLVAFRPTRNSDGTITSVTPIIYETSRKN